MLPIPNEAIFSRGNRKVVRVLGEDGQPGRPQPITTGVSSFDKTEVIEGLEEGQVIAIGGGFGRGRPGGRNGTVATADAESGFHVPPDATERGWWKGWKMIRQRRKANGSVQSEVHEFIYVLRITCYTSRFMLSDQELR